MAVDWIGTKPGTFINESTVVPLDADNMNAINKTLAKIAEGGENTGLDADTWRSLTPAHLWNVSDENLNVYYSFDSYFGDGKLVDDIGNNNDGIVFGNTTTEVGLSGRALVLNGTDSYVESTYTNSNSLSMSFWVKTQPSSGAYKIGSLFSAESSLKFYTELIDGEIFFKWKNASGLLQSISGGIISDNNYHHVCVTHNGISGIIYVDGILIQQLNQTLSSSYFNKLRIGSSEEITPTTFLQASIDDFRVYNRELVETEVYGLYFNKSGAKTQTHQIPTHQLFVDNSREDNYTQDGTLIKPFKTIQSAINSITDSSVSNSYEIKIISGSNYVENLNINKDYITISFSEAIRNVGLRGNISITGNNIVFSNVTFLGESIGNKNCIVTINSTTQKTLLFRYCLIKFSDFNLACSDEQILSYIRFFDCDIQDSILFLRGFKKEFSAIGGFIQNSTITIQESNFDLTSSNVKSNTFEFNTDSVSNLCSGYYDSNIYNVNSDSTINAYTDSSSIENTFNNLSGTINYKGDSARFIPSTIIYVDGNRTDVYEANGTIIKPFKTIQEALDVKCSNCEIWLYPKNYEETLVFSSGVVLRANSSTITQITLNDVDSNVEIHSAKITNLICTTINNAKIIGCEITNTTITDCKRFGVNLSYLGSISSQSGNASLSNSKINTISLSQDCFFDIHNCDFTGEAIITAIDYSKLFLSSCKKVETITLNTTSICKMIDCEFDLATCNNTETLTSNCIGAVSGINVKGFNNIISSAKMQLGSDAENDLYFRNSSGNLDRLAIGGPAQILSVNSENELQWKNEEYKNTRALTAGENILINQLCFISSDGKVYLTSANSDSTCSGELIIAKENVGVNLTGLFHVFGDVTLPSLIVGPYYVSEVSGEISSEPPTFNGKVVRCIGGAINSTTLNFQPSNEYFILQTPDDVEQNGYFFSNNKLETDVNGYGVYNDGAQIPVDGTGGTPTITLDFSNLSELIGVGCGKIIKPSQSCLGQGFSKDFSINTGFRNAKTQVNFVYKTDSTYVDGDLRIYIYDIDNATLLQNDSLMLKKSVEPKIFSFNFTSTNSENYRIIFHIANSNTNGFQFYFDNFQLDFKQKNSTIVLNGNFSLPVFSDREEIELFNNHTLNIVITLPSGETYNGSNTITLAPSIMLSIIKIGTVWINSSGNAITADKWATSRSISLTGAVTGSVSVDGSGNVSMATTANHTHPSSQISDATNANTANMIVKRDASGNFSAGTITAGSLKVTSDTDVNLAANSGYVLIGTASGQHVALDDNEIQSKANGNTPGLLWINGEGGDVHIGKTGYNVQVNGNLHAKGSSTSWGVTGANCGALTATMGTSTGATWLIAGFSGTAFRGGIQLLDSGGDMRLYTNPTTYITISGSSIHGNLTGNASTATTATNALGCSGNSATATKLATARTINGVSFNGTANITVADSTKAPTSHASSATTYGVSSEANYGHAKASTVAGSANGTASKGTTPTVFAQSNHVHPLQTSVSGNAGTATKLATARTIGGVPFNGSANISLPGVNTPGNQNTTGNAATATKATKLATARKINGVSFDGTADVYDTYSTSELRIGTWIDGKPIYRKVINFGTLPNATGKNVAHGISNFDKITRLYGIAATSAGGSYPLPYAHPDTKASIQLYGDKTNVQITTGLNRTDLTAVVIIEYT